jgi:hypothetical protein
MYKRSTTCSMEHDAVRYGRLMQSEARTAVLLVCAECVLDTWFCKSLCFAAAGKSALIVSEVLNVLRVFSI